MRRSLLSCVFGVISAGIPVGFSRIFGRNGSGSVGSARLGLFLSAELRELPKENFAGLYGIPPGEEFFLVEENRTVLALSSTHALFDGDLVVLVEFVLISAKPRENVFGVALRTGPSGTYRDRWHYSFSVRGSGLPFHTQWTEQQTRISAKSSRSKSSKSRSSEELGRILKATSSPSSSTRATHSKKWESSFGWGESSFPIRTTTPSDVWRKRATCCHSSSERSS